MRLDIYIAEIAGFTRTRAANVIKTGGVTVNGAVCERPSYEVKPQDKISYIDTVKYSSLGGVKLEKALQSFNIDVTDKSALDIGAANGGFTHCLLERGAISVTAVDLNVDFPPQLANDSRVTIISGTNARDLTFATLGMRFDVIVIDVSFISLQLILPVAKELMNEDGIIIALIKPQFEAGREYLPKSGILKNAKIINKCTSNLSQFAVNIGLKPSKIIDVPALFSEKNAEKLFYLTK